MWGMPSHVAVRRHQRDGPRERSLSATEDRSAVGRFVRRYGDLAACGPVTLLGPSVIGFAASMWNTTRA
jgi:hypothetical protein